MSFEWPAMLLLGMLLPLFILAYYGIQRRRQRLTEQYGLLSSPSQDAGGKPAGRRHLPAALFLIGLALLIVSLARPQTVVSLPRVEGTVILAFDVSGSMAADDLEPNRMEAAKAAARTFMDNQPSTVLVGVVAFSDSGFAIQSPTNDPDAVFTAINRLAPERGTSLANGILASLNVITAGDAEAPLLYSELTPVPTPTPTAVPRGTFSPAAIVLLTDGENNLSPDPLEAVQAAADRGVRIYTVGIGSAAGADLEVDGFIIHTQLDEALLQQIARRTGGEYYHAQTGEQLQGIYENLTPELVIKPEPMEVTSLFAGSGLLVLLAGGILSLLWFSRLP